MKGLYLYCIKEKGEVTTAFSEKGIDGKGEVFAYIYRGLEAIVSKVSLEDFGSVEIQKKSQEDLGWIKEKAVAHEKVIEEAMRNKNDFSSLIPMRFGTIFKGKTSLEETLDKDYAKIKEVLESIQGKQEWSVKAYLRDKRKIEQTIKENNVIIREKEKELAALPEGMAFFIEEELLGAISKEVEKEVENICEFLYKSLKTKVADSVRTKILEKELTGKSEPMILNVACLVFEGKTESFKKEIEEVNKKMQEKGVYLEYSGPWPAYSFTVFLKYD